MILKNIKAKAFFVDREHAVKLRKDEYFIADMIGLDVYTEEDTFFGVLKDVIETGQMTYTSFLLRSMVKF